MKKILILAAAMLLSVSAFASPCNNNNKTVQLTGFVADNNNEALAGASIYVDGKRLYSDFDGNFSADIKPGTYQIRVELISYEPIVVEAEVTQDENLNISLLQLHAQQSNNNSIADATNFGLQNTVY